MQQNYHYLALGDSYTIGEAVCITDSFPYQTVRRLRRKGLNMAAPEIIAKTGWTTDELQQAMGEMEFLPRYDFVSLLIGVNNQYRGREAMEYKMEFEVLLKKAIELANGKPAHVAVLSIPDYSCTPFAAAMDREKITREIDIYNSINRAVSVQYKVHYIDITPGTREAESNEELLTSDKLHPSTLEYGKWAEQLSPVLAAALK